MTDARTGGPAPRTGGPAPSIDEPPPLLGSWRNLYALLLVELAVLVGVFYALARWAA